MIICLFFLSFLSISFYFRDHMILAYWKVSFIDLKPWYWKQDEAWESIYCLKSFWIIVLHFTYEFFLFEEVWIRSFFTWLTFHYLLFYIIYNDNEKWFIELSWFSTNDDQNKSQIIIEICWIVSNNRGMFQLIA